MWRNADCTYNGNTVWNSSTAPGALIFASGTVDFNGTVNFYGVVYMANRQGSVPAGGGVCTAAQQGSTPVLTVHGGGNLYGGVFVDKCGLVDAGDQKFDINYDSSAFGGVTTNANALPGQEHVQDHPERLTDGRSGTSIWP